MSAHEQMRAMLDQLMGTSRNGDSERMGIKFYEDAVCKSFLLKCCPHEILSSTRMDLGECPKIHDLALRADFELASKTKDYFYDIDATEHLQVFIDDCDRRTESAKQRLAETQEELSAEVAAKAVVVHDLAEQIGQKLAKAESLGEEGMVEESMKLMGEIEELRKNKLEAEQEYRNSMPASCYQQQKLRVCEVCSAYLGIHDNDRRLADHFGGKLHLGFITIREKLAELLKTLDKRRTERGEAQREREHGRRTQYVGGRELDRRARRHRERDNHRGDRGDKDRGDKGDKERGDKGDRGDRDRRSRSRSRNRDRGGSDRGGGDRGNGERGGGDRGNGERGGGDRGNGERGGGDRGNGERGGGDRGNGERGGGDRGNGERGGGDRGNGERGGGDRGSGERGSGERGGGERGGGERGGGGGDRDRERERDRDRSRRSHSHRSSSRDKRRD